MISRMASTSLSLTPLMRSMAYLLTYRKAVSGEQNTSTQKLTGAVEKLIKMRPETAEMFIELCRLVSQLDRKVTLRGKERFPWEM